MKKRLILISLVSLILAAGIGYAAFGGRADILGTSISVGSADIKLLDDLGGGTVTENLVDSKFGPVFENISPGWVEDYLVTIFNNGTSELQLTSAAEYETANDPSDLRQIVFIEILDWVDADANGLVDSTEVGASHGKKTIVKWKTEGFSLGPISNGRVRSYLLRFSTDSIPDSKQGAVATFDFMFDATVQ